MGFVFRQLDNGVDFRNVLSFFDLLDVFVKGEFGVGIMGLGLDFVRRLFVLVH